MGRLTLRRVWNAYQKVGCGAITGAWIRDRTNQKTGKIGPCMCPTNVVCTAECGITLEDAGPGDEKIATAAKALNLTEDYISGFLKGVDDGIYLELRDTQEQNDGFKDGQAVRKLFVTNRPWPYNFNLPTEEELVTAEANQNKE